MTTPAFPVLGGTAGVPAGVRLQRLADIADHKVGGGDVTGVDFEEVHRQAIIVDAACPLVGHEGWFREFLAAGATAVAATVAHDHDCRSAMSNIGAWYKRLQENAGSLVLVTSAREIIAAKSEGKLGVIFHFQDVKPIEDDVGLLSVYHRLGVRIIQLAYNIRNLAADGCDEVADGGLSEFGAKLIKEMNRLGILLDLSHTGYRSSMEAMEVSESPVVFSHSNVRKLCDSPRNLTDDQIKAVARKGGVIGVNAFPAFVVRRGQPTLADLLEHVDYIARLVGVEHVGLGLDFFEGMAGIAEDDEAQEYYDTLVRAGRWRAETYPLPPWRYPTGLDDPSKLPNLTRALLERGYSVDNVRLILGGNFLRVFEQVWDSPSGR